MLRSVKVCENEKIFSRCVNCRGSKVFFSSGVDDMWERMSISSVRNFSEVISDNPCRMFFDFDDGDVYDGWSRLEPFVNSFLCAMGLSYHHLLLDSSDSVKSSLHVVTVCFSDNVEVFLLGSPCQGLVFLHKLRSYYSDADTSVLDLKIYSRNRCFRMLGNSKFGETRPLTFGVWSKATWLRTLVQPLGVSDHRQWGPVISRAISGVSECVDRPACVSAVFRWAGVGDYNWREPLTWTYRGHLRRGVCPFAGREHGSNNIFFVYKLGSPLFIKCHSCVEHKFVSLPIVLDRAIQVFLNEVI